MFLCSYCKRTVSGSETAWVHNGSDGKNFLCCSELCLLKKVGGNG
jgi:hypothetical protein